MTITMSDVENTLIQMTGFRADHHNGVNGISKLIACADLPDYFNSDDFEDAASKLVKVASKLDVRPNTIEVFEETILIYWYPKDAQVVSTRGQYAGLMLEFQDFLDNCPFKDPYIYSNTYQDDPEILYRTLNTNSRNYFPEFNSKCFGSYPGNEIRIDNLDNLL